MRIETARLQISLAIEIDSVSLFRQLQPKLLPFRIRAVAAAAYLYPFTGFHTGLQATGQCQQRALSLRGLRIFPDEHLHGGKSITPMPPQFLTGVAAMRGTVVGAAGGRTCAALQFRTAVGRINLPLFSFVGPERGYRSLLTIEPLSHRGNNGFQLLRTHHRTHPERAAALRGRFIIRQFNETFFAGRPDAGHAGRAAVFGHQGVFGLVGIFAQRRRVFNLRPALSRSQIQPV